MIQVRGYAASTAQTPLAPFSFTRREVGEQDVLIDIAFCGVCHSDLHQARDEWGGSMFPMVPGHEIVGRVAKVGAKVTRFKVGDLAGVGCMVDSCGTCSCCKRDLEQFCDQGSASTYNSTEMDRKTPTFGGYSNCIVVTERFVLKLAPDANLAATAPLLCAGITTYSPLKHWKVGRGTRVGVIGLGGLGHMGVKLAAAMGAEVTLFSTSPAKEADARKFGAQHFQLTKDPKALKPLRDSFDFILDTVSAPHDYNLFLNLLDVDGAMVLVGVPPESAKVAAFSLIGGRRALAGSLIGGIRETQEMLDFCAEKKLTAEVEVIPIQKINEAYDRMTRSDVRYRFSIDMTTL